MHQQIQHYFSLLLCCSEYNIQYSTVLCNLVYSMESLEYIQSKHRLIFYFQISELGKIQYDWVTHIVCCVIPKVNKHELLREVTWIIKKTKYTSKRISRNKTTLSVLTLHTHCLSLKVSAEVNWRVRIRRVLNIESTKSGSHRSCQITYLRKYQITVADRSYSSEK